MYLKIFHAALLFKERMSIDARDIRLKKKVTKFKHRDSRLRFFELLIAHSCVSRSGLILISPLVTKIGATNQFFCFHLQLTHWFLPRAVSGPAPEFGLSHEVLAASVWWNSVASLAETSGHRSVEIVSALHRSLGIWISMGECVCSFSSLN